MLVFSQAHSRCCWKGFAGSTRLKLCRCVPDRFAIEPAAVRACRRCLGKSRAKPRPVHSLGRVERLVDPSHHGRRYTLARVGNRDPHAGIALRSSRDFSVRTTSRPPVRIASIALLIRLFSTWRMSPSWHTTEPAPRCCTSRRMLEFKSRPLYRASVGSSNSSDVSPAGSSIGGGTSASALRFA